jgi:hypothetical protein
MAQNGNWYEALSNKLFIVKNNWIKRQIYTNKMDTCDSVFKNLGKRIKQIEFSQSSSVWQRWVLFVFYAIQLEWMHVYMVVLCRIHF